MNKEIIARRIKDLRTDQDMSQQQLANKANIATRITISKYENETSIPDLATLFKLAKALNTTVAYLIGETDYPNKVDDIILYSKKINKDKQKQIQDLIKLVTQN